VRRFAAFLLGCLIGAEALAGVGVVSEQIVQASDGRLYSEFVDGDIPGSSQPLAFVDMSSSLTNAGINDQETGTPFSYNVCPNIEGDERLTAILSIVPVSGDDPATEGWTIETDCSGDEIALLEHDGGETGSGRFKLRVTGADSGDDSSEFNWSFTAPVGETGYEFPVAPVGTSASAVSLMSTFENISISWGQSGNNTTNEAQCRYKDNADDVWHQCLNLWFDDRSWAPAGNGNEFRGSIVGLTEGHTYTVEVLTETSLLLGTAQIATLHSTNDFNVGTTSEQSSSSNNALTVTAGTAGNYRLYTGPSGGAWTIDGTANTLDNCVTINVAYVIIENLTCQDTTVNAIRLGPNAHHVVIRDSTIRRWGSVPDGSYCNGLTGSAALACDAAVVQATNNNWGCNGMEAIVTTSQTNPNMNTIVIEDTSITTPNVGSNSWNDPTRQSIPGCFNPGTQHPAGPMGIFLGDTGHTIIIRDVTIAGTDTNFLDDGIGGRQNFGLTGPFNQNSDIYRVSVSNSHDDCIESEGGNENVRIYSNRLTNCFIGMAFGQIADGPVYVFRNVTTQGIDGPELSDPGGRWSKHYTDTNTSMANYLTLTEGAGKIYKFHETVYGTSSGTRVHVVFNAVAAGTAALANMVLRCNVIYTNSDINADFATAFFTRSTADNNIVGQGHTNWTGATNLKVDPVFDTTSPPSGTYTLEISGSLPASDGVDDCIEIPNFNDAASDWPALDSGPDIGAVERGQTTPVYGPQ
jgi:hypothetical protein